MPVKTLAQEQFETKHQNEMELAKRELARQALDTIRIYNPLDHTFAFMYDRYWHRVPAKSYKDMDRYLAIHFFKKICDFMIGQQIVMKGEALKKLREQQMGAAFLDHYEENVQIWDRQPRLSDPDLIEQIKKTVIIGLVAEYGKDEPEPEDRVSDQPLDYRPLHEQIFSSITAIPEGLPQSPNIGMDEPLQETRDISEILRPAKIETRKSKVVPMDKEILIQETAHE